MIAEVGWIFAVHRPSGKTADIDRQAYIRFGP
jgi:hypothetical protein